jgi:hypothetical protein
LAIAPLRAQNTAHINGDFLNRGPSIWRAYRQTPLPQPNLANSSDLSQMLREGEGKLQLTLNDFLKLVVENGLDIEADRYNYLIAQTDVLRTKSGQAARGLPEAPAPSGLFAGAIGAGVGFTVPVSPAGTGPAAISGNATAVNLFPRGFFDPTLSANFSFDRVISPLNTVRVSGSPTVAVPSTVLQTIFQQKLPFGTSYSVSFNLQRQSSTQNFLLYNPAFQSERLRLRAEPALHHLRQEQPQDQR